MPKAVFRTDASLKIGTGHVYRCLSLADALGSIGIESHFVSRNLIGNLIDFTRSRGYPVTVLVEPTDSLAETGSYSSWLEVSLDAEIQQSEVALKFLNPDYLVVDHYALDWRWSQSVAPSKSKVVVYDDLANRRHYCDLLVDQNLGRLATEYDGLVPDHAIRLIGPKFSVVRPQFAILRDEALASRAGRPSLSLLVAVGGVDIENTTGTILGLIKELPLVPDFHVTAVLRSISPSLEKIITLAQSLPYKLTVLSDVENMASLMAKADIAVGGCGGTAWERCCLGLPTAMITLADNQIPAALALESAGAAFYAGDIRAQNWRTKFLEQLGVLLTNDAIRNLMSQSAARVCDGLGQHRIAARLQQLLQSR